MAGEVPADIGLIGLAVMGQNLILNMNDHGFTVAAFNRTVSKVDDFLANEAKGTKIIGTKSIEELMSKLTRDVRQSMRLRPLLSNLAVIPEYRRRGVASQLVARSEMVATQWGFDELLLLVSDDNTAARELYCRRDYREVGEPLDSEQCMIAPWYLGGGVTWRTCWSEPRDSG